MADKLADLVFHKRLEVDLNELEFAGLTAVKSAVFDLNMNLEELAEMIAIDWHLSLRKMASSDLYGSQAAAFFCLDQDDLGWAGEGVGNAETADNTLLFHEVYNWWHSLVGTQDGGQYMAKGGFYHFPPGIYTATNPGWGLGRGGGADLSAESGACLYYRLVKPTAVETAMIVARRR